MGDDLEWRQAVLHVLRIRHRSAVDEVAARLDAGPVEVSAALERLASAGLVQHWDGRAPGWGLTEAGAASHAAALADWRSSMSTSGLEDAYREFLQLNGPFKQLCTDHQLGGDPDLSSRQLEPIDRRVRGVIATASGPCPHMRTYAAAFARAYERITGGDLDALTRPLSGSYHDLWMELHQDLLVTLGHARGEQDR